MTDSKLTEEQAITLLKKLATDDDFRNLFENKPALALTEMGVSADVVVRLKSECLAKIKLASKEEFLTIVEKLEHSVLTTTMTMWIPQMKLPQR